MNKHELNAQVKSSGTAYLFWFLLGAHYAYLGKWGLQILFWITVGGLMLWWLIDLFRIPGMTNRYNAKIFEKIEAIEKQEKEEDMARQIAMIKAAKE